jgi:hypothetical protein
MDINSIDFNELWKGQKAEQPNTKDLLFKLNNFKKKNRNRIIISNVILILTSLFILLVWYYYQPQFVTTKIGIVLTILAMFIFVISLNKSLGLLKKTNVSESNQHYLKTLLSLKEKEQFMQTTMLNLYFVLLSTGIALYMYEYTSRMTTFWALFTYGITALWILFNWFYLRPKQIKKQRTKLNEIIDRFENIQSQIKQE